MMNLKTLERTWLQLKYFSSIFLKELRKTANIVVGIVGLPTEIRTGYLPNERQNGCSQGNAARCPDVKRNHQSTCMAYS
jgi:hypothetical protein